MLLNTVYALLAERAEADDRADRAIWGDVDEASRETLMTNRSELDEWLLQPIGTQAEAEKALIRHLGGAA